MKAFVFPGQGSQYPGMGEALVEAYPEARQVFAQADEVLAFPLSSLCFEGPKEKLTLTENTQPALLTVSTAVYRILQTKECLPDFVAGHSLGEYSALVAAEAISFEDALKLVRARGEFMQQAVPIGVGAMAAIIGLDLESVEELCQEAAQGEVLSPANVNSPVQIAVAGTVDAVQRACELAKAKGARRAILLPVSAPFHCSLMRPVQEKMASLLEQTDFRDLKYPLVNNVDAKLVEDGNEAREGLIRQISSTVLWTASIERLQELGARSFVEVGAGSVLSGLIRRILPDASTFSIENPSQVEEYV